MGLGMNGWNSMGLGLHGIGIAWDWDCIGEN